MTESHSITLHNEPFRVFLENERIEKRIAELGHDISRDYEGLRPVFIIVLNGAFMFAASLLKAVTIPCETNFIRLSSYSSKQSGGKVFETMGIEGSLQGRDLVIVEDIVDTGLSMAFLLNELRLKAPRSVRVASLLYKPEAIKEKIPLDYIGFEIENRFVVGYGLDYDGLGRNYPDLYVNTQIF